MRTFEEESDKTFMFTMDEIPHYDNVKTGCCDGVGKICSCGGFMHYQGVYGGQVYKCEACKKGE